MEFFKEGYYVNCVDDIPGMLPKQTYIIVRVFTTDGDGELYLDLIDRYYKLHKCFYASRFVLNIEKCRGNVIEDILK